jgi:hypothetical protein
LKAPAGGIVIVVPVVAGIVAVAVAVAVAEVVVEADGMVMPVGIAVGSAAVGDADTPVVGVVPAGADAVGLGDG